MHRARLRISGETRIVPPQPPVCRPGEEGIKTPLWRRDEATQARATMDHNGKPNPTTRPIRPSVVPPLAAKTRLAHENTNTDEWRTRSSKVRDPLPRVFTLMRVVDARERRAILEANKGMPRARNMHVNFARCTCKQHVEEKEENSSLQTMHCLNK